MAAAGSGSRLGAGVPKALVPLQGRALVAHAVERLAAGGVQRAVVTIPADARAAFTEALAAAPIPTELVVGGAERQESVERGLAAIGAAGIVLVHDAARALVPAEVVSAVITAIAAGAEVVTPVVPVTDSIRQLDGAASRVIDRSGLRAVQTPQGFNLEVLRAAHAEGRRQGWAATDDAGLCELAGQRVTLVDGSPLAFKITAPLDLTLAEAILAGAPVSAPPAPEPTRCHNC